MSPEGISYEDYLAKHESLTYTNVGASMMPLLREGKDLFTVRKKGAERCRAGDVVLYRRTPELYVLHRIVEVRPDSYVMLGDHNITREYGIRDEDILGVMTGFVRDGKTHTVDEPGYRVYSWVVMHTEAARTLKRKGMRKLRRLMKRAMQLDEK